MTAASDRRNYAKSACAGVARDRRDGVPPDRTFSIDLKTDKYQVVAGGPVDLIVVITNTSNHDVDCTVNGSNALDRNYVYDVTDEEGRPVPKIEKKHHGGSSVWPCVLKPGQSETPGGGRISVLYDFSRPGKYTIQVSRGLWGDENHPDSAGTGQGSDRISRLGIFWVCFLLNFLRGRNQLDSNNK